MANEQTNPSEAVSQTSVPQAGESGVVSNMRSALDDIMTYGSAEERERAMDIWRTRKMMGTWVDCDSEEPGMVPGRDPFWYLSHG